MAKTQLNVRVDVEVLKRLREIAGRDLSAWVREAIDEKLNGGVVADSAAAQRSERRIEKRDDGLERRITELRAEGMTTASARLQALEESRDA